MDKNDLPKLLTKAEAAGVLRIGIDTLDSMIRRGDIQALRIRGKRRRVLIDAEQIAAAMVPLNGAAP
jgi:excisionase family DNA binding protein